MNFNDAMTVIENYKINYGFPGLLETLADMRENTEWLDRTQRQAFCVVFSEMSRLFAPVDQ